MTLCPPTRRGFFRQAAATLALGTLGNAACRQVPEQAAPAPASNDATKLTPVTTFDGPALELDFPGLSIGSAAYPGGPTGCTVFRFDRDPISVLDIRGGSVGTIGGSSMENGRTAAICFAGGSLYGLEAASGVAAELFAQSGYADIKLVRGAIIWDFWRKNRIYPDKELGRAALRAARPGVFAQGRAGVGSSAACAGEETGQGGAFREVGKIKVAVFTVVNASGVIVDRQGRVVRGNLDARTGVRTHPEARLEDETARTQPAEPAQGRNTTLTLVVTNRKLGGPFEARWSLDQLARQVHAAMARSIQPFHTQWDGDALFAVTTDEVESRALDLTDIGLIASELAWDAVLASFRRS